MRTTDHMTYTAQERKLISDRVLQRQLADITHQVQQDVHSATQRLLERPADSREVSHESDRDRWNRLEGLH